MLQQGVECLVESHAGTIGARTGQGDEDIGDSDNARGQQQELILEDRVAGIFMKLAKGGDDRAVELDPFEQIGADPDDAA